MASTETDALGHRYDAFSKPLYAEISKVQEKSSELYSSLKNTPSHICGVEILKLFFIDLLGRDSEEAKIFESTFESNLKAKPVVSIYLKVAMLLLMVGLNVYFVYMSLLYCSDKSHDWQFHWFWTFVSNVGIDLSFNCISEAYILKYLVPMTINSKIGNDIIIITVDYYYNYNHYHRSTTQEAECAHR